MYDISELPYFSVLVLVIHVGEISVLWADGKGIVATSYEVHSTSSITASLQGSAEAPCEFAHSERHFALTLHVKKVHSISIINGAIGKYKIWTGEMAELVKACATTWGAEFHPWNQQGERRRQLCVLTHTHHLPQISKQNLTIKIET